MPTISRSRQRMYSFGKFSDASSDQVDFMSFLDATRQFAPNMASQLEATYRQCILYSTGTDMFDYLTGMSLFLPETPDGEYRVYGAEGTFLALSRMERGRLTTIKSFFPV